MRIVIAMLLLTGIPALTGCTPRIEVAAPKDPITINMNVKIEHEIHIKVDKDVETLIKNRSDLFGQE
ncbi:YnbE family lipoprotein [Buttiauxella gaviniae]|uniref:YnbE family lipoprotein n=1 Tax=Buttiauxella gaviniae TaxID=82990 RepID=A0ABV3NZV7_9ENTR